MIKVNISSRLYLKILQYCHNELDSSMADYIHNTYKATLNLEPSFIESGCPATVDFPEEVYYTWFIMRWS